MRFKVGIILLCVFVLMLWAYIGYWKYVYEPIDRKGFARGVSVGIELERCGISKSPRLIAELAPFVDEDFSTHNCQILHQISAKVQ
jgi:hypothetical protein